MTPKPKQPRSCCVTFGCHGFAKWMFGHVRFCASTEPQIPAYSVLLCRLTFPYLFLLVMGFWHSSFPFSVTVLVQEPSATYVEVPVWVSLPCWPGTELLPSFCFFVCVLNILGLKVSFQVMAESAHWLLAMLITLSFLIWWTGLQPWQWRGAAKPGTSMEPCSEFTGLVKGCRFAKQSLHWR